MRTCIGCREVRSRPELVRLAVGAAGAVTLDVRGQLPGRGAYLCRDREGCLAAARRRRALTRSLRVGENAIDYEALGRELGALEREETTSPR